jgi:serine/threonine-protein kinase
VLPEAFSQDAERLARFTREAQTLAALNHPNIAAIYGIEESSTTRALVMELVEGRDLSAMIQSSEAGPSGPAYTPGLKTRPPSGTPSGLPLEDVLPIARQIAEALEAAHDHGIIHRDLKPANIKVRADGTVKVLDFGLAKAMDSAPAGAIDDSPTITSPAITELGMILGTAAYMAPEQARGKNVDKRADVWAFGVIVYEMLTGTRLFIGVGITDVLAAVLRHDIDWTALPPNTPPRLRHLLERCLDRDVKQRLRDIGEARVEIAKIESGAPDATIASGYATPAPAPSWRRSLPWAIAAAACIALTAALVVWSPWRSSAALITRITLSLSPDSSLTMTGDVAISPDGRTVVFTARSPGSSGLFVRRLDEWQPRKLALTEGANNPFFSPDGGWIAFQRGGNLEKMPVTGGPPQVICRALGGGGRWRHDNTIVFGAWPEVGLWRVSADGGTPQLIISPSAGSAVRYLWPESLPGDKGILFMVQQEGRISIAVLAPGSETPRTLVESGSHPRYLPTGHLVYVADNHLFAVPFDVDQLEVRGGATVVVDDVTSGYDVSVNGVLVYLPAGSSDSNIVWRDRQGVTVPLGTPRRQYRDPTLSPDGRRLSVVILEGTARNIWTGGISNEPLTRLTFGNDDFFGLWSREGTRLFYTAGVNGSYNMFSVPTDGSGKAERLTQSTNPQAARSSSPSGDTLLFNERGSSTGWDIWELRLPTKEARPVLQTPSDELEAVFSPSGQWIAYQSNETGSSEVYVQAYPGPGRKRRVSLDGGGSPFWSHTGGELFYSSATAMFAVPVLGGQELRTGTPQRLFALTMLDVSTVSLSADDQRFLMLQVNPSTQLNLVQNWFEDLKTRVPGK